MNLKLIQAGARMYKILFVFIFVLIVSCGDNSLTPVSVEKRALNVNTVSVPSICVTTQNECTIYEYEKIFSDGVFLNITFPECKEGECGISIECSSIIYYETFK